MSLPVHSAPVQQSDRYELDTPQKISASDNYYQLGNKAFDNGDYAEAIEYYFKTLKIDSKNSLVIFQRAMAYEYIEKFDQAISDYTKAIEIDNNFDNAYFFRGITWEKKGNLAKAISDYSRAIDINPHDTWYFLKRARAKQYDGKYEGAVADYIKSVQLAPMISEPYNNLSWLYSTCPDHKFRNGTKAVSLAEKSVGISKNANTLDTLAAAYAEVENYKKAENIQKQVVNLLNKNNEPKKFSEAVEKLNNYKANLPWRE
jgi:tetratricopeptide (TPR) repeat protein